MPLPPFGLYDSGTFPLANTLLMLNLVLFTSCTNLAGTFYHPEPLKTIASWDHVEYKITRFSKAE